MLRLDALDLRRAHLAGQERIFAEGVVAAAELEIAIDIHERLQRDVDAQRAVFAPDHHAVILAILGAECRGHAHGRRLALRGMPREHAGRPVGKAQPRDAQPRNSAQIAGLPLVHPGIFVGPVNQHQLLLESHLAEQFVYPRIPGDHGNGLRACCSSAEKNQRNCRNQDPVKMPHKRRYHHAPIFQTTGFRPLPSRAGFCWIAGGTQVNRISPNGNKVYSNQPGSCCNGGLNPSLSRAASISGGRLSLCQPRLEPSLFNQTDCV